MKNLSLLILLVLVLVGCEEKMVIIPDRPDPASDRVILVEEFTGASCANCPAGSKAAEDLIALFPNNVVVVGLHSNFLAWPVIPGELDFRTQDAQDIEDFLGQWRSKPEAAFNRKVFHNRGEEHIRVRTFPDTWINYVQDELQTFAKAYVDIESDYDHATRQLDIIVSVTAQEALSGDYRMNVAITESGMVASQKDGSEIIDDFVFKHALRELITDVQGDRMFSTLDAGLVRERSYSFTLPDEEDLGWWIPDNCSIVAFLTDGSTKEVVQAAETHLVD